MGHFFYLKRLTYTWWLVRIMFTPSPKGLGAVVLVHTQVWLLCSQLDTPSGETEPVSDLNWLNTVWKYP